MEDISGIFNRKDYVVLTGSKYFRFRIMYSLLTFTPIEIKDIRPNEVELGLRDYEISFLKLIEKLTNGSKLFISSTGTSIKFIPGTITNNHGDEFEFECHKTRGLSYYIEGITPICLFGKETLNCVLKGSSNNNQDLSVDCIKIEIEKIVERIVVGDSSKIEIKSRSFGNTDSAVITFRLPIIRFIEPFTWVDAGKVKKIGGHCLTINTPHSNGIIDETRIVFNRFINEVWIDKNTQNGKGVKPGYGLSLWALTTENRVYCYDHNCYDNQILDSTELSHLVCRKLLEETLYGGAVDTHMQSLVLTLMSLAQNVGISKVAIGRITEHSKGILREIKNLFRVKFKIEKVEIDDYNEEGEEGDDENAQEENEEAEEIEAVGQENEVPKSKYLLSCIGSQMENKNRVEG